jgi:hypothetical protein
MKQVHKRKLTKTVTFLFLLRSPTLRSCSIFSTFRYVQKKQFTGAFSLACVFLGDSGRGGAILVGTGEGRSGGEAALIGG